ncbi:MAG: hypothetical protein IJ041_07650 [Clostridia bacterium]|nr:hypothetical protein [Clostridia bacterium]
MKCEKCGSENVVEGKLSTGLGGLVFTTAKAQKKLPFTRCYSTLTAKGCRDCGAVFDVRMEHPERIEKEEN